jgi:hypothetical protein
MGYGQLDEKRWHFHEGQMCDDVVATGVSQWLDGGTDWGKVPSAAAAGEDNVRLH